VLADFILLLIRCARSLFKKKKKKSYRELSVVFLLFYICMDLVKAGMRENKRKNIMNREKHLLYVNCTHLLCFFFNLFNTYFYCISIDIFFVVPSLVFFFIHYVTLMCDFIVIK